MRWGAILEDWKRGHGPLYRRLATGFEVAIRSGRARSGVRLPTQRALVQLLGISRNTAVAAYDHLAANGWVERRVGSGTYVAVSRSRPDRAQAATPLALVTPMARSTQRDDEIDLTHAVPTITVAQQVEMQQLSLDAMFPTRYFPAGIPELRAELADMFTADGLATDPQQVIVTTGAQQALSLVAQLLLKPGDQVVLETPTYFGAIDLLRAHYTELVPVPMLDDGWDLDLFERAVRDPAARLAFLTPTFHNPTSLVMGDGARRRVARAITGAGVALIEDDTLIDLSFAPTGAGGRADAGAGVPRRIAAHAPEAVVFNAGSLSKLYWHGLRVGWLRVPELFVDRVVQSKALADFGTSLHAQHVAAALIADLPRLRHERRARVIETRDRFASLLDEQIPEWRFTVPDGGQFLWVELPTACATAMVAAAARHGVRLFAGATMDIAELPDQYVRLPFTLEPSDVEPAVHRLAAAWATLR